MNKKLISAALLVSSLIFNACTDLNETLYDKVSMDDYGKTSNEVQTIVAGAYATLRGYGSATPEGNGVNCYPTCEYVFFLNECASDEACIPTRGTDWYDGGRYQQMQYHTWDAQNQMILSAWRYSFIGISKINAIIYQVDKSALTDAAKSNVKAELRGLRAYYYYLLLDQFGAVPITTDFAASGLPKKSTRQEVFAFVEKELTEIMDLLPSGVQYARFTQNVANTLLARLYLNAEVYTGTPRWQDCLNACEKVTGYSLTTNYFESFKIENQTSPEIIFAIPYDHKQGTVGNYLASMTYHYNQKKAFTADESYPWCGNGICAQPGLYSSFEATDVRRNSLMIGQQKSAKDGSDILMDNGEPLNYTEEIVNYAKAKQNEGARLNKYAWSPTDIWERDNDWVVMRYAEVLMMKAEANYRLGYTVTALPFVNQLRTRAGLSELASVTEDNLDLEWRHEFVFEGLRRTTNIRFGTFFKPWWNKGDTPKYRGVYPIPQEELAKNPGLEQNPDYN
ncbi:RagB/SusD family nutrient uptake outer membrane protein [Bacteroidaceae bacterium HV4-6-C5C]|jgi:SusD family.|nr:RagB/SusD family nutrient uptake outer membrane protein [Bacteroidaceae bacterium HV4-6-C5C]